MLVRFLFSEAVTGFALEQVTAPSGELSDLSGGPVEFTAVFTPAANVESLDTRIVLEGGYTDLAGNSGMGSESASFVINSIAEPTEDFGDAPAADQSGFAASYPVTKLQDGARHLVGPLFLGRGVMATADGVSSISAAGDGDDDGVVAMSALVSNPAAPSLASVTVISSGVGKLDAWIDFNQHGAWHGENDRILASVDVEAGLNLLTFVVPQDATPGQTYARFRLSSTGGLLPTGPAIDGEVEDYQVTIVADQEQAESPDLATMLWNPVESGDVAGDGEVRPADALLIINYLNRNGATVLHDRGPWQANVSYTSGDLVSHDGRAWIASRGRLVDSVPGGVSGWTRIGAPFYDVDGDGRIDPADALRVINILNNQRRSGPVGETPVAVPPLGGFNRAGHRIIERQSQDNELRSIHLAGVKKAQLLDWAGRLPGGLDRALNFVETLGLVVTSSSFLTVRTILTRNTRVVLGLVGSVVYTSPPAVACMHFQSGFSGTSRKNPHHMNRPRRHVRKLPTIQHTNEALTHCLAKKSHAKMVEDTSRATAGFHPRSAGMSVRSPFRRTPTFHFPQAENPTRYPKAVHWLGPSP